MLLIQDPKVIQEQARRIRLEGKSIGLVPTMGALHEGHLSLLRKAREENDFVILTLFVNPIQFAANEDLDKYPRTLERDRELCEAEGADILFAPKKDAMYPEHFHTHVDVDDLTEKLCGASRPGHFRGVTTVVSKLFHLTHPSNAYFGQKDYQQALVIRRMVKDLNFDLHLHILPTVREKDGLALSSRNSFLSPAERKAAPGLQKTLQLGLKKIGSGERDAAKLQTELREHLAKKHPAFKLDYLEILGADNLASLGHLEGKILIAVAAFLGQTRLIDNVLIDV